MSGELHFNKGFHAEVYAAVKFSKPLFVVYGPCGTTVECTASEKKARGHIESQYSPDKFVLRRRTGTGMLTFIPMAYHSTGFSLVDLISRTIK